MAHEAEVDALYSRQRTLAGGWMGGDPAGGLAVLLLGDKGGLLGAGRRGVLGISRNVSAPRSCTSSPDSISNVMVM